MDLSRYVTALQRFYYDHIGKKCLILLREEISKQWLFHFGLLLTFTDDMFDGNMAAFIVECHNFHLSLVEQKLDCGEMSRNFHR